MSQQPNNRRDFLKAAASLGAASVAAPYVWTSKQAKAQSANDGFGVLSVGVRGRGGGVGRSAGKQGRVVAVCDVDTTSAAGFNASLRNQQSFAPKVYKDYRKALEQKDIDIVTVGTPDHWHTAIVIAALRAGKDVYCEKPMTLTIEEGQLICQAVKETGRVVQVGTQQRSEFERRFLKAVVLARSGRLGNTLTATCMIGTAKEDGPFPTSEPPASLDWDFWLGQTPVVPYTTERCHGTFRWWYEYSGGKMTDWGAHHVDIGQWAIGAENTGPIEIEGQGHFPQGREATLAMVSGEAGPESLPNGYNTVTEFKTVEKFANGNTVIIQHGPENGVLIEGEKGRIFVNRGKLTGALVEDIDADPAMKAWLDAEVVKLYKGKPIKGHMNNFIQSVQERSTPISDVFTHHRTLSSCHLSSIALLCGRKLQWDPDKEDFVGDEQASGMRAREQREPYTIDA